MPQVAVIIPCFNHAAWLPEAVHSVLAQTRRDLEVVIVDDGSTDSTPAVAARLAAADPRVRVRRQENAGLAASRNAGLAATTAPLVHFLDADDTLAPAMFEVCAAVLEEDARYGLVYCDAQRVDAEGRPLDTEGVARARRLPSGNLFNNLLVGGYFPPHAVLTRRSWLERVGGFRLGLDGHADYDLWLRLAGEGCEAFFVARRLAFYRQTPGQMSRDYDAMVPAYRAALRHAVATYPERTAAGIEALARQIDDHRFTAWRVTEELARCRESNPEELARLRGQLGLETARREALDNENALLRQMLAQRDAAIEKLRRRPAPPMALPALAALASGGTGVPAT